MCGILGQVGPFGEPVALAPAAAHRWLDTLAHRGPDGRGEWRSENVWLGHTRLAIRDPHSAAAAQPMTTPCGRYALTFNGEIYNDDELRARLGLRVLAATHGHGFATRCDAETLLWVLALEGERGLARVRGMYAFAFVDLYERALLLARDPLGVKPLVWSVVPGGFAFASEVKALTAHVELSRDVDRSMLGAYLVTGRRVLGERTMLAGVRNVLPGTTLRFDLTDPTRAPRSTPIATASQTPLSDEAQAARHCRDLVVDSVHAHLASDVPVCALLSGGLDSAIVAHTAVATGSVDSTWCASGVDGERELGPDPAFAREVAARIGTHHHDVHVDRATFEREWRAHVAHLGQPLSTPNEVAIACTARAIAGSHSPVTLSGEGADELFGGYGDVLAALSVHASLDDAPMGASRFHLEATAWTSPAALGSLLVDGVAEAADLTIATYERCFASGAGSTLRRHLEVQRAINLVALLERLDAATMRFGVEGRTPFADARVHAFAQSLPDDLLFRADGDTESSKRVLRGAFAGVIDRSVIARPKASFPLPFEPWSVDRARALDRDPLLGEYVHIAALRRVAADPRSEWRGAWLLSNLATWLADLHGSSAARAA